MPAQIPKISIVGGSPRLDRIAFTAGGRAQVIDAESTSKLNWQGRTGRGQSRPGQPSRTGGSPQSAAVSQAWTEGRNRRAPRRAAVSPSAMLRGSFVMQRDRMNDHWREYMSCLEQGLPLPLDSRKEGRERSEEHQ